MRKHVLTLAALLFIFVLPAPSLAAPAPSEQETVDSLRRKVIDLETQLTSLRTQLDQQRAIKEELQQYRAFVEQERKEAREFLQTLLNWGSGIVALFIVLMGFLGIKSWKDARDQIQQFTSALEKQTERQISEVRNKSEEAIQKIAEDSIGRLKSHVSALQHAVNRELRYRQTRVLAVGYQDDLNEMENELSVLRDKGINVTLAPHPVGDLLGRVQATDIVLYRYRPAAGDQDPCFRPTLEAIKDCGRHVPLLVYAPSITVQSPDKDTMHAYRWGTFAQSGATLVSHMYLLTHLFQGGKQT